MQELFGIDLTAALDADNWTFTCRCFQKRHLLAHSMGIVDDAYMTATDDPQATVGRKVSIQPEEVESLLDHIRRLGSYLTSELEAMP